MTTPLILSLVAGAIFITTGIVAVIIDRREERREERRKRGSGVREKHDGKQQHCINLPAEMWQDLDVFAKRHHISKSEAMARAFAVLSIANKESGKGNKLVIADKDEKVVGCIAGL